MREKRNYILLAMVLALSLWQSSSLARVSPQPNRTITWQEQRSWQQYYDETPLEVAISLILHPGPEDLIPIRISGVWNNRRNFNLWRNQPDTFVASDPQIVHGYIDEVNLEHIPRFKFVGDNWYSDVSAKTAKTQIIQAFAEWSSLQAGFSPVTGLGLETGLEFRLVEPTPAVPNPPTEIELYYRPLSSGSAANTDRTINADGSVSLIQLSFNANNRWWFGSAASTPPDQMHFYSSALHELGHIVGLWESNNPQSVMIYRRNPGADGPSFDKLDEASKWLVYALYSRPGS